MDSILKSSYHLTAWQTESVYWLERELNENLYQRHFSPAYSFCLGIMAQVLGGTLLWSCYRRNDAESTETCIE